MAKKKNRRASPAKIKKRTAEPSYWMVIAFIAVAFAVGLTVKIALSPQTAFNSGAAPNYSAAPSGSTLESQVKLVTANFKCACGDLSNGVAHQKEVSREPYEIERIIANSAF